MEFWRESLSSSWITTWIHKLFEWPVLQLDALKAGDGVLKTPVW